MVKFPQIGDKLVVSYQDSRNEIVTFFVEVVYSIEGTNQVCVKNDFGNLKVFSIERSAIDGSPALYDFQRNEVSQFKFL
jgi:hypothetical protein